MTNHLHHYKECGLDYIYLQNGFEIHETPYGKGVSITAADQLHEVIAREIVVAQRPIRGMEIRFLRSMLDLSQSDLAKLMGTTRPTLARWEGKLSEAIPGTADTAIRFIYTGSLNGCALIERLLEMLRDRDDNDHGKKVRTTLALNASGGGWDTARAA